MGLFEVETLRFLMGVLMEDVGVEGTAVVLVRRDGVGVAGYSSALGYLDLPRSMEKDLGVKGAWGVVRLGLGLVEEGGEFLRLFLLLAEGVRVAGMRVGVRAEGVLSSSSQYNTRLMGNPVTFDITGLPEVDLWGLVVEHAEDEAEDGVLVGVLLGVSCKQKGHCQAPRGGLSRGGTKHSMWQPRSHLSQNNMLS